MRNLLRGGECTLQLQSGINDRIQSIQHFADWNVVFVASRDGKYQCWKFPDAWRDELIEKKEREFIRDRKIVNRMS